jgi:hypothetical protein
LRFFSPASLNADVLCPTALAGLELVPCSNVITLSSNSFGYTSSMARNVSFWRLSKADISDLEQRGLKHAANLLNPSHLSEFAAEVRSSLITFSKGCTLADRIERLGYVLSSLESVLLKHEMEPVQASVAERLELIITGNQASSGHISQLVRRAYQLRKLPWTHAPSLQEQKIVAELVFYAHEALSIALLNTAEFETKAEFLTAIQRPDQYLPASDNESTKNL